MPPTGASRRGREGLARRAATHGPEEATPGPPRRPPSGDPVASRGPRGVRGARERRGPPRHTPPGANCDRGLRRASRTHPRAHPKHKITNGYKRASAGALRMAYGVRPRSRGRRRASKASRWSSMTTMSHRFSRVAGPRGTTRPRAGAWRVTAQNSPPNGLPGFSSPAMSGRSAPHSSVSDGRGARGTRAPMYAFGRCKSA